MGKIRIKTLGLDDVEEKQKKDAAKRRAIKKETKKATAEAKESKSELAEVPVDKRESKREEEIKLKKTESLTDEAVEIEAKPEKKSLSKKIKTRKVGKRYAVARSQVEKNKDYSLQAALDLLRKVSFARFDGTVELHVNAVSTGLKGEVKLPHSTGKKLRVAIFSDELLKEIESGKLNFDLLVARPSDMPSLVSLAKTLGPRGLMPNPKRGTVSENPEEAANKLSEAGLQWKTEPKAPLIHLTVGKLSFKDEELIANSTAILKSIGEKNIAAAFLTSSMSPSVRLKLN